MANTADFYWVPANGGTETETKTRTGHTVLYMWNTMTGAHQYYNVRDDLFIANTHEDMVAHGLIW